MWPNSIGRFRNGSINSQGERILEFSEKHKFVLDNTLFNHKNSRRTIWHSPNWKIQNHIDFKSSIINSSTRTISQTITIANDNLNLYAFRQKLKEATKTNSEMKDKHKQINIQIRNLMEKSKINLDIISMQQHKQRHVKRKS